MHSTGTLSSQIWVEVLTLRNCRFTYLTLCVTFYAMAHDQLTPSASNMCVKCQSQLKRDTGNEASTNVIININLYLAHLVYI